MKAIYIYMLEDGIVCRCSVRSCFFVLCFYLSCSYVPTHLHMMVFELVKNSVRAVQERFMDSDKVAPPIRIIVADGLEDVTIKACPLTFFTFYRKQFLIIL